MHDRWLAELGSTNNAPRYAAPTELTLFKRRIIYKDVAPTELGLTDPKRPASMRAEALGDSVKPLHDQLLAICYPQRSPIHPKQAHLDAFNVW